jgi:two-component system OmpR family response regulator
MRVLLVEDDAMIGEAIHGALKDASYAADWVKNGQAALTTLTWCCSILAFPARMVWRC